MPILLTPVREPDYPAVVALANLAYRGGLETGAAAGWNVESGIVAGPRLNEAQLREDLAAKPQAHLLLYCEAEDGPPLGSVWLEPAAAGAWYLGLLTIHPSLQDRGLGRDLLAAAEAFAREHGAVRMRMTVLNVRGALIAWYERRGYRRTGETQPFPYGDDRFGTPLRDDLEFVVLDREL
jgi:ribosomal protein S18 acetylase RimI-like enzyme